MKCIFFLNNKSNNWKPATKQTQSMRNSTNSKIRLLKEKYYKVKNLFDQLGLKKDLLFEVGRELENEFKYKKNITHLQTQAKRMKECIIIWFTEFLYDEIFQPNSIVLQRFLEKISQQNCSHNFSKAVNTPQSNITIQSSKTQSTECQKNKEIKIPIKKINDGITDTDEIKDHLSNTNELSYTSNQINNNANSLPSADLFSEMKFNREIDSIEHNNKAYNRSNETNIDEQNNDLFFLNLQNFLG